ncbi:MAG: TlpA family protein disulfide reductase [Burkholderiaceae bacterium]|nr:MAG: TlpA family protein disulfide reductase [Burkholderiaceae bacterium]TBR75985.1 MAG: TlpA family protein disulfide reductase [Burkholderiaceae bacterium]
MNQRSAPSDAPAPPAGAGAKRADVRNRPVANRRTLIAAFGVAALLVGAQVYRRRLASAGNGATGVAIHSRPRELPLLRFTDETGASTSLATFRGRVVVLNVWATWCLPCREEMPTLDRLQAALGGPNFEVVTVSIDKGGLPVVQAFFRQIGVKHLHPYFDTYQEGAALGAAGIPLTLLIDRDGREAGRKLGPAKWDDPQMIRLIRQYLPAVGNR